MKIYLASASPRRKELLSFIFSDFEIACSTAEEYANFNTPSQYVMDLSYQKAKNVYEQLIKGHQISDSPSENILLIGADTIVFHDGQVLGKPNDKSSAFEMLKSLSGDVHQVYTGVTLLYIEKTETSENFKKAPAKDIPPFTITTKSFCEKTDVYVSSLTDEEINAYIETGEPFDKAGGYGIQGAFGKHISKITGDYYNVVGLPVHHLYEEVKAVKLQ